MSRRPDEEIVSRYKRVKKIIILLLLLSTVISISACSGNGGGSKVNNDISGKTFVWEKPGFGGDFNITLQKDGKYQYYEGFLSSYIGMGTWTEKNGIVTLTETSGYDYVFRFAVKDGGLSFIAEGSSMFMYVTVKNGDMFLPKESPSVSSSEVTMSRPESYTQISQEEAKEMMKKDDGHVIVDVRRQDEYDSGHIPGAILIPNESIGTERPKELPDLDQIILIYCRSGRRSKEAAQKLFNMGYTRIYEFGGIIDWTGDIVKDAVTEHVTPTCVLVIQVGDKLFYASLEDNSSAKALVEKLNSGPITVEMHDYGSFEKVGSLPWMLPRNDEQITTVPGDIILYQGNQITIYYDTNSWSFTRLAKIGSTSKEELLASLGSGNVSVSFYLEWSE